MNIGIVSTWFERGAAYVSKQYMDAFVSQGHQVKIYARGGEGFAKGDPVWDGEHVYWQRSNTFPIFNYVELAEFKNWVEENNFDFILFNEQVWFEPVIFCRKQGIKVGAYIDYYTEPMIPCFNIYDFVVCNTHKHYQAFKNHPNPIYIPWGTDTTLFDATHSRKPSDNVRFFHSCGMNPHRKGTDLLLKAYLSMTEDELLGTQLIIHSQVSRQQFLNVLDDDEKIRFSLLDGKQIQVVDQTVTAPGLYHLGDVYVYPSRLDGLGLTVCEAISCGMPIIVPDDGPMNEFATSKYDKIVKVDKLYARYDGYYWPQNEVDVFDLKLKMLDTKNTMMENKFDISENTRHQAVEKFSWLNNAKNLAEIIKEIAVTEVRSLDIKRCCDFNEKKFPKIIKLKKIYKLLFSVYIRFMK